MSEALSAREANSLKIRASLIAACGDLLVEKPIDAVTINNIVEKAGVAKGSFYNHFPDKETLADAVSEAIFNEVELAVRKSNENVTDPAYKIVRGMCNHVQLAVSDPKRAIIMARGIQKVIAGGHPLDRTAKLDITDGIESGRFEQRCEDAGLIQVMGAVYFTNLRILAQSMSAEEAIELCTKVFTLILCGFGLDEKEAVRIVSDSARDIVKASPHPERTQVE
ncbi:MAG: TetR/AcrR family transcriptional regulator [Halioglobus sp.]